MEKQILAPLPVHFVSLAEDFIVWSEKLLKPQSWMKTEQLRALEVTEPLEMGPPLGWWKRGPGKLKRNVQFYVYLKGHVIKG